MIILQSTEQSGSILLIEICHLSSILCFNNWDGLLNQSKWENKGCWQCRKHLNATQGKQQCRETHRGRNSHLISCSLFSSTTVGGTLETTTCMSKALTTDTYNPHRIQKRQRIWSMWCILYAKMIQGRLTELKQSDLDMFQHEIFYKMS